MFYIRYLKKHEKNIKNIFPARHSQNYLGHNVDYRYYRGRHVLK